MDVERMRQEFERRRNAIVYRLRSLPGVSCFSPSGAFYVLPNVTRYLDREFGGAPIRNTYGLAYYLLKEAHVAVVPGEAFGTPAHVRISFATSMDRLEEGARRIEKALASGKLLNRQQIEAARKVQEEYEEEKRKFDAVNRDLGSKAPATRIRRTWSSTTRSLTPGSDSNATAGTGPAKRSSTW